MSERIWVGKLYTDALQEIKKLNYTAPRRISNTATWKETVNEVKSFIERKADASLVSEDSSEFKLDSIELPGNRFYADINTAHLECFFKKGSLDYLVVFFSGARTRAGGSMVPYPTFSSWSWYKDINASILCIDDPMYKTFPEMEIGWYYGTQTDDFRYDISLLIVKIAKLLGVRNKHIILYGRSGGGTAAIAISNFMKGCCVCSINAQIDLQKYPHYAEQFSKYLGIDIYTSADFQKRNDFAGVIKNNPENTYLVITNIFSQSDAERSIPYFVKNFNMDIKYGISSDSNFYSWVYAAWGVSNAHNSFDSVSLFKIILETGIALSNGVSVEDVNVLAQIANDFWFERYGYLVKQDRYEKKIRALNTASVPVSRKSVILNKLKKHFPKMFNFIKKSLNKIIGKERDKKRKTA